jgi:hypothetical protein
VVTVYADVHQPGGLGCRPQVTVDPGDDSGVRSLFPRAGSLLTGRLTVVWDEPGRHVVRARRSSECASPPVGGGAEPEYDDLLERTVSVRG